MTTPSPAPGWYPDPSGTPQQRYFDGQQWTENYAPFGATTSAIGQPPKSGMSSGMKIGLGLVAVVLAFIALGSFSSSGKKRTETETKPSSTTPTSSIFDKSPAASARPTGKVAAPVGSTVRDGKFEFKVLGVTRGATSKDGGFGTTDNAKGEYFSVRLQVTNIGDDARTLFASNQHLIVNGNKYDASSRITDDGWKEDINPGLGATTTATFDIPPGATPTAIECHDSAFSGGALLAL